MRALGRPLVTISIVLAATSVIACGSILGFDDLRGDGVSDAGSTDGSSTSDTGIPDAAAVDGSQSDDGGSLDVRDVVASAPACSVRSVLASVLNPRGLAVTADATIAYVSTGNMIDKVDLTNANVTPFAGQGVSGMSNGPLAVAMFAAPHDLLLSADEQTLYVADTGNDMIRAIDLVGATVSTFAGVGAPGQLGSATFDAPAFLAQNAQGMYVGDTASAAVTIISGGKVTSIVNVSKPIGGLGAPSTTTVAALFFSRGETVGMMQTNDPTDIAGATTAGSLDGIGPAAQFDGPAQIAPQGDRIFVADTGNNRIRRVTPGDKHVDTVAGPMDGGTTAGAQDGTCALATFSGPSRLVADVQGNLWLTDASGPLREISGVPGQIKVTWLRPDSPSTGVVYVAMATPMDGAGAIGSCTVVDQSTCSIGSLTSGTSYAVTVGIRGSSSIDHASAPSNPIVAP
ncbi:MAG TPA: hypothetical protein VF407_22195 [Polyangiaceae bacterium]